MNYLTTNAEYSFSIYKIHHNLISWVLVEIIKLGCTGSAGVCFSCRVQLTAEARRVLKRVCTEVIGKKLLCRKIPPDERVFSLPGSHCQAQISNCSSPLSKHIKLNSQANLVCGTARDTVWTIKLDLMSLKLLFRDDVSVLPWELEHNGGKQILTRSRVGGATEASDSGRQHLGRSWLGLAGTKLEVRVPEGAHPSKRRFLQWLQLEPQRR